MHGARLQTDKYGSEYSHILIGPAPVAGGRPTLKMEFPSVWNISTI